MRYAIDVMFVACTGSISREPSSDGIWYSQGDPYRAPSKTIDIAYTEALT